MTAKDVPAPGFYNLDCMEALPKFPDGFFDLAIVDPPYGDGNAGGFKADHGTRFGGRYRKYKVERRGGQWAASYGNKIISWDSAPGAEYFAELFRVSKNQIIWGGNYFDLPPTRCFVVWVKTNVPEDFTMSQCEYAWTSFNDNAKVFECSSQGSKRNRRIHPTQKPIALYEWLLKRYAGPGYRILDTHVGSASSLIACHRGGFEYWGYEIDGAYYDRAKERLDAEKAQITVFDLVSEGSGTLC